MDFIKRIIENIILDLLGLKKNTYHPLVFISGEPIIGEGTYIGFFTEIYAKGANVIIGKNCDIASFVAINCADSHKRCMEHIEHIIKKDIIIEDNVFIGSHTFVGGYTKIGHHSVIGAGTILINAGEIPPYSLIVGNPPIIRKGYYTT